MPESVENWWNRRRRSKGLDIPYKIGTFRSDWERYPVLVRQFHPDLNGSLTLTQIPPAADVYLQWQCDGGHRFVATPIEQRERPGGSRRRSTWCPECTRLALDRPIGAPTPGRRRSRSRRDHDERMPPGTAFFSARAPAPASAAESDLRIRLGARLDVDLRANAVAVRRAFHQRFEVWPDIVIADLMVAIEYDTTGPTATEHVGSREHSDLWKDRVLRDVGWEVVRLRTSKLRELGPYDIRCSSVTDAVLDRLIDRLAEIRGELIVAAYRRRARDEEREDRGD